MVPIMDGIWAFKVSKRVFKMIWIDVSNAPHVKFAKFLIDEYGDKNILVSSRNHSNTIDLLDKENIKYFLIGKHWGKGFLAKIFGLIYRTFELYKFLYSKNIKVGFSQSSFYSPLVCFLLRKPCIYTNDNEYAKGNIIAEFFASAVLYPNSNRFPLAGRFCIAKIFFYDGIKEFLYIKTSDKQYKNNKTIWYYRPEPEDAQYYKNSDQKYIIKKYIKFAKELNKKIVLIPRSDLQREKYKSFISKNFEILDYVISLDEILKKCDMFIGAGGTMTRELAASGISTISIYSEKKLFVDEWMHTNESLKYDSDIKNINDLNFNSKKLPRENSIRTKIIYLLEKFAA